MLVRHGDGLRCWSGGGRAARRRPFPPALRVDAPAHRPHQRPADQCGHRYAGVISPPSCLPCRALPARPSRAAAAAWRQACRAPRPSQSVGRAAPLTRAVPRCCSGALAGELLCKTEPIYGTSDVAHDEEGYAVGIMPCVWNAGGDPSLPPAPVLTLNTTIMVSDHTEGSQCQHCASPPAPVPVAWRPRASWCLQSATRCARRSARNPCAHRVPPLPAHRKPKTPCAVQTAIAQNQKAATAPGYPHAR